MSDEWKNSLCWNTKVITHNVPYGCTVEMSPIGRDKIDEISIFRPTTNPNMVICRAFNTEGKPIYETSAKCGPNDVFDFNIGAKLALDRLYEGYDMIPKPKRKPYNGLIYIAKYPGVSLKNKSIYRVKDGVIQNCESDARPFIYEGMSDAELSAEIDDVVYGRAAINFGLTHEEEKKYPLTVAHFVDNDKT